jgi:hypothetical protein
MSNETAQGMTVQAFIRYARDLDFAFRRGANVILDLKALIQDEEFKALRIDFVSDGKNWMIVKLFGREILFRTEVVSSTMEMTPRIVAYLNESSFHDSSGAPEWQSLDVSVDVRNSRPTQGSVFVSVEAGLLESVINALFARQVVFRPSIPSACQPVE